MAIHNQNDKGSPVRAKKATTLFHYPLANYLEAILRQVSGLNGLIDGIIGTNNRYRTRIWIQSLKNAPAGRHSLNIARQLEQATRHSTAKQFSGEYRSGLKSIRGRHSPPKYPRHPRQTYHAPCFHRFLIDRFVTPQTLRSG